MILASTLAVRGGAVSPFLQGNAKIYDGTFDFDTFNINGFRLDGTPFYILIALDLPESPSGNFFSIGDATSGGRGLRIRNRGEILLNNGTLYIINPATNTGLKTVLVYDFSYNGTNSPRLFQDGIEIAGLPSIGVNSYLFSGLSGIGARRFGSEKLNTNGFKQLEFVSPSSFLTDSQIIQASLGGSFRAAGIAHNSGGYLLAVDFDRQNGQPLTTFSDTPSYNITSFGGSEYIDYESL